MNAELLIEAILFYRASPMRVAEIAKMLGQKEGETEDALRGLEERFSGRGVRLIRTDDMVALATAPEAGEHINALRKEELSGELGRATLETLATVLYRAPVSKSEIDYIRGVNSTFSLRSLLVRGLVERKRSETGTRGFVYSPTIDTLAHLGIARIDEIPDYAEVREEVQRFRKESQGNEEEPAREQYDEDDEKNAE